MSNHLETLNPIIRELVVAGVDVGLTEKGYTVGPINKIGSLLLIPRGEYFESVDRYDKSEQILCLEDVLAIYCDWWTAKPECGTPTPAWSKLLIKFGYARERTTLSEVRLERN